MTDEEIEKAARELCEALSLDPDRQVEHGFGGDMTPAELASAGDFDPDVMICSPRWRTLRYSAVVSAERSASEDTQRAEASHPTTQRLIEAAENERRQAASICVAEARAENHAALRAWAAYIPGSREVQIDPEHAKASRDALMSAARKIMGGGK